MSNGTPAEQYPELIGQRQERWPRNGLGPTSVVLGIVGVMFGIFPPTFFIAGALGVAGFLLGRVGHRRCMIGKATNGRVAMAGSVISGAAVVLACIGAIKVFSS